MAVLLLCIGVELCLWALVVKPGVGDYLENLDIDGMIILNLILKKQDGAWE